MWTATPSMCTSVGLEHGEGHIWALVALLTNSFSGYLDKAQGQT